MEHRWAQSAGPGSVRLSLRLGLNGTQGLPRTSGHRREYSEHSIIITIIYYLHSHMTFNYITLPPLANCLLKHAIKNVSGVYLCNIYMRVCTWGNKLVQHGYDVVEMNSIFFHNMNFFFHMLGGGSVFIYLLSTKALLCPAFFHLWFNVWSLLGKGAPGKSLHHYHNFPWAWESFGIMFPRLSPVIISSTCYSFCHFLKSSGREVRGQTFLAFFIHV